MEHYFLCECGAEFETPQIKITPGDNANIDICPDCKMYVSDWMIKEYSERLLK